jgi:hypothetical protein
MTRFSVRIYTLLLSLTLLLCALGTAAATAAPAMVFQFPYFANPQNPCTNEPMVFEGQALLVYHLTMNSDESFRVSEHLNTQGVTATGVLSGDTYTISDGTNLQSEYDITAQPTTSHMVHHLEVIHAGEAVRNDDYHEYVSVTTTWIDGVPTPTFDRAKAECK